jgi:predicted flap endonuclease-1-like 5' DNA nuclease
MADLMRVSGIGGEYAELLHAAGVDTVKELRTRNADNLAEKAKQINEEKSLTRVVPTSKTIAGWITQAEALAPAITH